MADKIGVIANPASGDSEPDYETLSEVFSDCGVQWERRETEEAGDARRIALELIDEGMDVVVAYGGDGTVAEVAGALVDSQTTMGILPGGTANVVAMELDIPSDLRQAAYLLCGRDSQVDQVDVGQVGDRHFLLRVGMGYEARLIREADRQEKNRMGFAAYLLSGLKNLRESDVAEYRFRIDGEEIRCRGFTCAVANSGSLGIPGLRLGNAISVRDGRLDVVLIEELNWRSLLDLSKEIFGVQGKTSRVGAEMQGFSEEIEGLVRHWQGAEIEIEMDPLQTVQYDGEVLESVSQPIRCSVIPQQLRVVVPEHEHA